MITLDNIRKDMEAQLNVDSDLSNVEVNAESLDDALSDAAVQLNTNISSLQYEIIDKGSEGFFGLNKKPWRIKVYENPELKAKEKKKQGKKSTVDSKELEIEKKIDRDGMFFIRHFEDGIYLKVLLPIGSGKNFAMNEVMLELERSDTRNTDQNLIKKSIKTGTDNKYIYIGNYEHSLVADAVFAVDICEDEMKATITASEPAIGGAEISEEKIKKYLNIQGVTVGIDDEKIMDFVDKPVYNIPFEVATAVKPVDGKDAYVSYNFETDRNKLRVKEAANGQMNFKELNLIQNVIAGQPLAKKIDAEKGSSGKTVTGKYLEAKNGKDIRVQLGKNVKYDTDGKTIVAEVNGQVLLINDKISVEPIFEVDNVDIKTGNITFLGTVIVKNNVEDGFDITASGNIEIGGTVGKSHLEADGDIIVTRGMFGGEEGTVKAGGSLWAKFLQQTNVDVGEYVIVSDSIMNSEVSAMKKIILQGKKAQITGGHLFATEEICAKRIGSPGGGAETILEVGFDPKAKKRLTELQKMQSNLVKDLDKVELDINTLQNQKKMRKSLSAEKQKNLKESIEKYNQLKGNSEKISTEIQEIEQHLRDLKVTGKIKSSGLVYAGVKIYIRDVLLEIRIEVKNVTFYLEKDIIRQNKYEPPEMEDIKVPDGYSSN